MKRMAFKAAAAVILASVLVATATGCASLGRNGQSKQPSQAVVEAAASRVKASLVRIKVVEPTYWQGRENKTISFGSGCIITPDGYVITNHHVAGKAISIVCTLPNREEVPAILVGTDPATDIAVIKLMPDNPTVWPFVPFGDSDSIRVGDQVLALGSPVALSQSVTSGIVSNTAMITPPSWGNRAFTLDGENVGELVRWIGHDAAIFPGNSGGPLVNLRGEIIGVNEIGMGLGGAIPGNLVRQVADEIIARGSVRRAYTGVMLQPLLRHGGMREGVLISTVLRNSPAAEAELQPGDVLLSVGSTRIEGRFAEDLPGINQILATLPIGSSVPITVLRNGERLAKNVTPVEREPAFIPEREVREWGMSARNLTLWSALEMAREGRDGVLITAHRSGGPLAKARPELRSGDVILEVDNKPIQNLAALIELTDSMLGGDPDKKVPVLVKFERSGEQLLSVVEVGIDQLSDPDREVVRGWLPVETQVITRELADKLGLGRTQGVRVTRLYNQRPDDFPLQVGDFITHLEGEVLPASRREDADVFRTALRQYRPGREVPFGIIRDGERKTISVRIMPSPTQVREMKRLRDVDFEFIVREAAWQDMEKPTLAGEAFTVIVDDVVSGGWAGLGGLQVGDVLLRIDGVTVEKIEDVRRLLDQAREQRNRSVVLQVRRDIRNEFIELEPKWN